MRKVKNVTAILIDDNATYRYLLAKRLNEIGVEIIVSMPHNNREALERIRVPGLVFISYDEGLSVTRETIGYVRRKFLASKIIIAVSQEDKNRVPVDQLQHDMDGLIYKADLSLEELRAVVQFVKNGKKYFQNPNKKFP